MANIDAEVQGLSELTRRAESGDVGLPGGAAEAPSSNSSEGPTLVTYVEGERLEKERPPVPVDLASVARPPIANARSGSASAAAPGATHPKKFSAVNINKKFLEKTSSPSGPSQASSSSAGAKSGGPVLIRPAVQVSTSHSRLVTTKLTAAPQSSSTAGPGWSRPPSAASPSMPSPSSSSSVNPPPTASQSAVPQLPHAGKVIQPQPRTAAQPIAGGSKKEVSGKPVWGNVKATMASTPKLHNDFPTAAEVAQVATTIRKAKLDDSKEAAEAAAADKLARSEEADTFRGVHLDPNAHHWDEMEEDDDNFLDGVIEFGDGRQYKIQPSDAPPSKSSSPPREPPRGIHDEGGSGGTLPFLPVSKEERFADDFDRSWPRSKTSPAVPVREYPPHAHAHPIPSSPASSHSPQESSRVLFNERSNRLEPYSNSHPHRQGPYPPSKRGSHPDFSPTSSSRDALTHAQGSNVQLLQKPGGIGPTGDFPSRARGFSNSSSSHGFSSERPRVHIPPEGADSNRTREPSLGRSAVSPATTRDRDFSFDSRGRRPSTNMGPPPLPSHSVRDRSNDSGRQIPPHLAHMPPLQRRLSSREPHPRPPSSLHAESTSSIAPSSAHPANQSPVLSHVSFAGTSVSDAPAIPPGVDVDEVRKAAMHSAAERAKQRRQQEEEEREREKERARKKAAELEVKMKSHEAEKSTAKLSSEDAVVIGIIEEAVKPPLGRQPSLKPLPRQSLESSRPSMPNRRTSQVSATGTPASPIAATDVESWRSKTNPRPLSASHPHARPSASPLPSQPPPVLHTAVDAFIVHADDEELEIVDFSELGKLVGAVDTSSEPAVQSSDGLPLRPSRPVASDFFDDQPQPREAVLAARSDVGPWRRKQPHDIGRDHAVPSGSSEGQDEPNLPINSDQSELKIIEEAPGRPPTAKDTGTSEHLHGFCQTVVVPPALGSQRTPRTANFYHREATISALDDAMSRIKGALDGMQAAEAPKGLSHATSGDADSQPEGSPSRLKPSLPSAFSKADPPSREAKWVPPALRHKHHGFDIQPEEVFDITRPEPPRSPKPAWGAFNVRLPQVSHLLEQIPRRQLTLARSAPPPPRWEILSWNPPVEDMRRDFSLNDVLFGRVKSYKGKVTYRIALPRRRFASAKALASGLPVPSGPKVHLPSSPVMTKVNGVGAFGRPTGANNQSTWRKPTPAPFTKTLIVEPVQSDSELNTVSRSPPPELSSNSVNVTSIPASAPAKDTSGVRSRSEPKMRAGLGVAFYRDSRVDTPDPDSKAMVNFIVHSELDESSQSHAIAESDSQPLITVSAPSVNGVLALPKPALKPVATLLAEESKSQSDSPEFVPSPMQSKAESKSSDDSADRTPMTPPSHHPNAAWTKSPLSFSMKDSPARAPDPEHLKAVWSQASDKARVHAVNSLEGIADDLTALPFTLQDVKSEDGETPPPSSGNASSRMSLHEVTRAFQQVPSPSSSPAAHRTAPLSPPLSNVPVMRQPNFAYSVPPANPNMRLPYAGYASPVMSHSPSPTMMYPHPMAPSPVPGRMAVNGHSSLYSQPVWMPLPGPAGQGHGGMMRPTPPPYPAQLMPYPSPGGAPAVYHPQPHPTNIHNQPPTQQNGGAQNRARGMSVMSPVMSHAGPVHPGVPMYGGSPVLMHSPVMQLPPGHGYMGPMPPGRGQTRTDSMPGHPVANGHHLPPHTPGYNPVSPATFARPTW